MASRRKSAAGEEDNRMSDHGTALDPKSEEQFNYLHEMFGTHKKVNKKKNKMKESLTNMLSPQKSDNSRESSPDAPLPTIGTLRRNMTRMEEKERRESKAHDLKHKDTQQVEELEDRAVAGRGSLRSLNRIGRFKANKNDLKSIEEEFARNVVKASKRSSFEEKAEIVQSSSVFEQCVEDLLESLDEKSKLIISVAGRTKFGETSHARSSSTGNLRPSLNMFDTLCYTVVVCSGSHEKAEGLLNWLKDVYNISEKTFEKTILPRLKDPLHVNLWTKKRIAYLFERMDDMKEAKSVEKDQSKILVTRLREKKKILGSLLDSIETRISDLVHRERMKKVSHLGMLDKLKVKVGGKKKSEKIEKEVLSEHEQELQTSPLSPNADLINSEYFDSIHHFEDLLLFFVEYENIGVHVSREQIVVQSSFHTLSPTARQVLERFVEISDLPLHLFYLNYFVLLSKNLTITAEHFQECMHFFNQLLDLQGGAASVCWTHSEMLLFHQAIAVLFVWLQTCVLWYHLVFSTGDKSFKACLSFLKILRDHVELNHIEELRTVWLEDSWQKFLSKHIELAVLRRYYFILKKHTPSIVADSSSPKSPSNPSREESLSHASSQSDDEKSSQLHEIFSKPNFKFWSAKKKEQAKVPVAGLEDFVRLEQLQEEEAKNLNIKGLRHLLKVLDEVMNELKIDVEIRKSAFEDHDSFSFPKLICQTYFPLVWSDFQMTLRHENQKNAKLDAVLHNVYSRLKTFYTFIASIIDLPDLELQPWFAPFIDRWLEDQNMEFSQKRVRKAVELDKELKDSKCSSSVFDLFAFLYQMGDIFKLSPYSEAQALKFASLITDIVNLYISMMKDLFLTQLPKLEGVSQATLSKRQNAEGESYFEVQYPSKLLGYLNDIITCRTKLQDMLIDIDMERIYQSKPILHDDVINEEKKEENAKIVASPHNSAASALNDEEPEGSKILDQLNCIASFRCIDNALKDIGKEMVDDLNGFWEVFLKRFIWNEPLTKEYSQEEIEIELDPVCDNAYIHLKYFKDNLFMVTFLQVAIFEQLIQNLEQITLAKSSKNVLNKAQLLRVQGAFNLFREFIVLNGLSEATVRKLKVHSRLEFMISLLTTPTEEIIKMFESGLFPEHSREEQRIREAPYMSREHIITLFKFRKNKESDHVAEKFLREKLGFFQSLF